MKRRYTYDGGSIKKVLIGVELLRRKRKFQGPIIKLSISL
jgi:hypothetical protein